MAFFHSLQNSAFTEWLLGSESIWTYPTVLTLHTVGMAILVGASFVINLRILQVAGAIPLQRLQPLYRFVWIGFGVNLLSGVVLFITEAADRVIDPVFWVKMCSIAAALSFGLIVKRSAIDRADILQVPSTWSRFLAAASLALWTVAIVSGRLMAYLKK
jgi:hypothetical protein